MTQKDIARHLSVSQSLVAAVLANKSGVWVSEQNRQRIQRAAQEMHYRPNTAAQSLRRGGTRSFGLVTILGPDKGVPWEIGQIAASLAVFAGSHEFDLKFKFLAEEDPILDRLTELVETGWSDVLILAGADARVEEQGQRLSDLRMPFIVIGDQSERHPDWYQIDFDHEGMMSVAVAHLAARGHRRLAYLGHQTSEHYERLLERGFQAAMKRHFGSQPDGLLMEQVRVDKGTAADGLPASATRFVYDWLARPVEERPTAFVFGASDDGTWRETELALQRLGRRFGNGPGEIAAAGLHHTLAPLLFGQAQAFLQTDLGRLAELMCERLLAPLLEGERPDPHFLRVCPELQPLPTLDLGKHHF